MRSLLLLLAGSTLAACSAASDDYGSGSDPLIGAGPAAQLVAPVTDLPTPGVQAETQVTVAYADGKRVLMATYNDATNANGAVEFENGHRTVKTGASLMGWKYSLDDGASWVNGGNLAPPPGWAILWGDPSATVGANLQDRHRVFMTNLAAPNSKWPGSWTDSFAGSLTPLGGACIARSSDGGKTFSFLKAQPCVSNQGHFYDGSSMAAGADGSYFAAYLDVDTHKIDVWRAPNATGVFNLFAETPFPGITIATHPRLRTYAAGETAILYVAAQDSSGNIWMNRMYLGEWLWKKPVRVVTSAAIYPRLDFASMKVRTGPQFSFDVGGGGEPIDAVRLLFAYRLSEGCSGDICWATRDPNGSTPLHLDVAHCDIHLVKCSVPVGGNPSGWAYPQSGNWDVLDQFHPNIVYGAGVWKMTFWSREKYATKDEVALFAATLSGSSSSGKSSSASRLTASQRPCPASLPSGYNYWGDYDGMAYVGVDAAKNKRFIRLISDSTGAGCDASVAWLSSPVHVTSVRF